MCFSLLKRRFQKLLQYLVLLLDEHRRTDDWMSHRQSTWSGGLRNETQRNERDCGHNATKEPTITANTAHNHRPFPSSHPPFQSAFFINTVFSIKLTIIICSVSYLGLSSSQLLTVTFNHGFHNLLFHWWGMHH